MRILAFLSTLCIFLLVSCIHIENQHDTLPPGVWRGVLFLDGKSTERDPEVISTMEDDRTEGQLPFNFEVVYDSPREFHIVIHNADERIIVDSIRVGRDRATAKDTIWIDFPVYDSYIKAIFEEDLMEGEWVRKNRKDYRIPFVARHGKSHRFTELKKKPLYDLNGEWSCQFDLNSEDNYPAIGEFVQIENQLKGTFRTETGDYRYLEGTVQADRFYLSCFDGAHAFMFQGKFVNRDSIFGEFRSGNHYRVLWAGTRGQTGILQDPDSLTKVVDTSALNFRLLDIDSNLVSLSDPRYQGKAVLVQIMGTWCPNCKDETEFLVDFLESNPQYKDRLEIIGLAFEYHTSFEKRSERVREYINQFQIPYKILVAGDRRESRMQHQLYQ